MGAFENYRKKVIETFGEKTVPDTNELAEEWTWVTGYKGTNKNMICRDYQYELGEPYSIPDGEEVKMCSNGFHFCEDLSDVFQYYDIGLGNRFFEVTACVRKSDLVNKDKKRVAKEIVFLRELSRVSEATIFTTRSTILVPTRLIFSTYPDLT